MNKLGNNTSFIILCCAAALFLGAGSVLLYLSGGTGLFNTAMVLLLAFTLAALAAVAEKLKQRLKTALYSYTNICLAGLALFFVVLFIALLVIFFFILSGDEEDASWMLVSSISSFPRLFSISGLVVIVIISLFVCVSNFALIRHEGACLNNLLGILLGGFFLLITVGLIVAEQLMNRVFGNISIVGNSIVMFLSVLICYFECIFIGSCIMSFIAVHHVPAYDKDFIIILGCSIDKRGGLLPLLKGRANRAVRFAWDQEIATGKHCLYVPSGGQGPNEVISEGSAMELYLLSHGAEDDEVFPEKKSTSTWENMLFSKKIIDGMKPGARVAFSTTNYHIYRSGILAKDAGLDAEGIASDTKWYFWPNGFVREFFAILAMKKNAHILVAAILAVLSAAFYAFVFFSSLI